jgi:hypothetical protein
VEVSGARHLAAERAVAATGLRGAPLFRASAADARAALLGNVAVRDARVEIRLPDAVARVTLAEREAVGRWVVGAVEWFVDGDGVLFPSDDPTAAPALRVRDLRGGGPAAGDRVDAAYVSAALRLAKIAPGELRPDAVAPAVRVEPGPDGIVLASGAGWEIRFGTPERIEEKLAVALRSLREDPARRIEYVDVRTPQFVVIK